MDIQAQSGPERSHQSYEQRQRELINANRALVRQARENLSAVAQERLAESREARRQSAEALASPRRDALELSAAARAASEPSSAEREARVRELAQAHRMERLHTPERIERAAQRLLEG
jgi:uncharacterized membrane protein